jgi:hypothetical protein
MEHFQVFWFSYFFLAHTPPLPNFPRYTICNRLTFMKREKRREINGGKTGEKERKVELKVLFWRWCMLTRSLLHSFFPFPAAYLLHNFLSEKFNAAIQHQHKLQLIHSEKWSFCCWLNSEREMREKENEQMKLSVIELWWMLMIPFTAYGFELKIKTHQNKLNEDMNGKGVEKLFAKVLFWVN